MKTALTIEQMKTLIKLGVDVSNAQHSYVFGELKVFDRACRETTELNSIPAFTIADLLDILPKKIEKEILGEKVCFNLEILWRDEMGAWISGYLTGSKTLSFFFDDVLIDTLYELTIWCIEQEYIK